jgi:hypothetical protein
MTMSSGGFYSTTQTLSGGDCRPCLATTKNCIKKPIASEPLRLLNPVKGKEEII